MQKTCNNWFGMKQCNITLQQTKIGKHECDHKAAVYKTRNVVRLN